MKPGAEKLNYGQQSQNIGLQSQELSLILRYTASSLALANCDDRGPPQSLY